MRFVSVAIAGPSSPINRAGWTESKIPAHTMDQDDIVLDAAVYVAVANRKQKEKMADSRWIVFFNPNGK